jgi:hypothetical protein
VKDCTALLMSQLSYATGAPGPQTNQGQSMMPQPGAAMQAVVDPQLQSLQHQNGSWPVNTPSSLPQAQSQPLQVPNQIPSMTMPLNQQGSGL